MKNKLGILILTLVLCVNLISAIEWDVTTASYKGDNFDISSEEGQGRSLQFKPDGTKIYVVGYNDYVYQYRLLTAWNISTAIFEDNSTSIKSEDDFPTGLFFKSDGSKMYIVGAENDAIHQYSLSTAWNVSTASYDTKSHAVGEGEDFPSDIFFQSNGSKMFVTGTTNDVVYQYTLSTAWDVSTAGYDGKSSSIVNEENAAGSLFFKSDGTRMYIAGDDNIAVHQYTLSTAWNVSTASYDSENFSVSSEGPSPQALFFRSDGEKMYFLEMTSDKIYEYDLPPSSEITITLISPADNTVLSTTGANFTANYSISGTDIYNFTNATYYVWNSTGLFNNSLVTITGVSNTTTEHIDEFVLGNYEWNVWACWGNATFSNCSFADANYSLSIGATINDINYNVKVYETSSQTFIANISLLSGSEISLAQLIYNGTSYDISDIIIDGEEILLTKTIDIPINSDPLKNTTNAFWFSFTYTDVTSTNQSTTSLDQNVSFINLQLCDVTYNTLSINLSLRDELTKSLINPSANNTNNQAFFDYWLGSGTEVKNYSFERLNSATNNTYEICIFPNKTFRVDMDMIYSAQAYDERTYRLRNASLTNITSVIDLFLLFENLATKFTIEVRQGVSILTNAIVTVARFFVGEGAYRTISIRETDSAGEFVEYLDLDNDYRYSIVKDGVLLGVIDKKATCTEAPCEFTLQIPEDVGDIFQGYKDNYALNVLSNLSFNIETNIVTYNFIDITGLAQYFRLRVNQGAYNGTGNEICNQQMFSSSGSMTCNLTGYEGNFVAVGTVSRSPELITDILGIAKDILRDTLGLMAIFISFAIILTITIAGAVLSGGNPSMVLGGFGLGILATKLMTLLPFSWGLVVLFELVILVIMGWLKT